MLGLLVSLELPIEIIEGLLININKILKVYIVHTLRDSFLPCNWDQIPHRGGDKPFGFGHTRGRLDFNPAPVGGLTV